MRARIDLKYLLSLDLEDAGFDASVLSEFRGRLAEGGAEERLLEKVLHACRERGLLKKRGQQRTDSTHVLAAVRELSRLELVSSGDGGGPECAGRCCARLASRVGAARVVQAIWPTR